MLIFTYFLKREHGPLSIEALTNSFDEFKALESTLLSAGIKPHFEELKPKEDGRMRREYLVDIDRVSKLEEVLRGKFDPAGTFVPIEASGNQYACQEITVSGWGTGCQVLLATMHHIAITECAIMAGRKKWFGGVAKKGKCGAAS